MFPALLLLVVDPPGRGDIIKVLTAHSLSQSVRDWEILLRPNEMNELFSAKIANLSVHYSFRIPFIRAACIKVGGEGGKRWLFTVCVLN